MGHLFELIEKLLYRERENLVFYKVNEGLCHIKTIANILKH